MLLSSFGAAAAVSQLLSSFDAAVVDAAVVEAAVGRQCCCRFNPAVVPKLSSSFDSAPIPRPQNPSHKSSECACIPRDDDGSRTQGTCELCGTRICALASGTGFDQGRLGLIYPLVPY